MDNFEHEAVLFADESQGIYIPQFFAESHDKGKWTGIKQDDLDVLLAGPGHEHYWGAWDDVLVDAETVNGGTLYQDGDLWVVWTGKAIEYVNDMARHEEEYATEHKDAGDRYSHLPREGNFDYYNGETRLAQFIEEQGINCHGMDIEQLADIVLDNFGMVPGGITAPGHVFTVNSFPIDEIEMDIERLGIDQITLGLIKDNCDCVISSDSRYGYVETDAVWRAQITKKTMQDAIDIAAE